MEILNSNYGNESKYDSGLVYYREKRKLRSPPGYEIQEKKPRFDSKMKISLGKDGSLLKMCYRYISENLENLESLVGLPEIIGRNIFNFMLENGNLQLQVCLLAESKAENSKLQCLKVFDEAFPDQFLKSLSLTFFIKPLEYLSNLLLCFENIEELDLSGNRLNDEVLIAFNSIHCLKTLVLVDCCLTDFSVKKLTLPYRLYGQRNILLETLNLKDNKEITDKSIDLLLTFSNLKILNISGSKIKKNDFNQIKLNNSGFHFHNTMIETKNIVTQGWAKPIIDQITQNKKSEENTTTPTKRTINFYSSVQKNKKNMKTKTSKRSDELQNYLFIVRKNDLNLFTQKATQDQHESTMKLLKEPNASNEEDVDEPVIVEKNNNWLNFESEDEEEDALFSQYSR